MYLRFESGDERERKKKYHKKKHRIIVRWNG